MGETIHTYMGNCGAHSDTARKTLVYWKDSWEKNGWETRVLSQEDAMGFEGYKEFVEKIGKFPSVNPLPFDFQGFMRWFCMAHVGGWSSEPDVINYGMKPNIPIADRVMMYSPVPALAYGTKGHYQAVVDRLLGHEIQEADQYEGRPHLSDQDFLARYCREDEVRFEVPNHLCSEYTEAGWETAKCVHYGTPYMIRMGQMPKHEWVPKLREMP